MAIDLQKLLSKAFFTTGVADASESIELARERYTQLTKGGGMSFELVAPPSADANWIGERLVRPLVYYCDSIGAPLPRCGGVFLSLFVGEKLYCVMPEDVFAWAAEELGLTTAQAESAYGTHERDTWLR